MVLEPICPSFSTMFNSKKPMGNINLVLGQF